MRQLPNILTCARVALTAPVCWAIVTRRFGVALVLTAIAGATDGLDGFLARRWNAISRFGAYVDPIADKTLLSASYIALGVAGAVPVWLVVLIFGRDLLILAMAGAALLFTSERNFAPSVWGKLSTFCQIATVAAILTAGAFPAWRVPVGPFIFLAAAATAWSGLGYVWRAIILLNKRKR